jgi:hypothetical protein
MTNDASSRAAEGIPEQEPETIGEALKKCHRDRRSRARRERSSQTYYEEQLTNGAADSNVKVLSPRMAELEKIFAQHATAFN